MRNITQQFLIIIILVLVLNGCSSGLSSGATPQVASPTLVPPTLASPTLTPTPQIVTIIVTSAVDSGPGTLRQALLDALPGDIIAFDPVVFPPDAPVTIYPNSDFPPISQGQLSIDASNAGVIIDGSNISGNFVPGLQIISNGNSIQGFQVVNFSGPGIILSGSARNNMIGGERSIGLGPLGQGNLISGNNMGIGLWDEGTSDNTITGNLIGTAIDGVIAQGNYGTGVYVSEGASRNTIGPDNIIAFNGDEGIQIYNSNSLGNSITENSIHDNVMFPIYLNDGGNNGLIEPIVFDFDLSAGTLAGTACASCTVQIFSDEEDSGGIYEGQTGVDSQGAFAFDKGAPFIGPNLTATVTDRDGNTSQFSSPTSGTSRSLVLQSGNSLQRLELKTKQSGELEDNRIGDYPELHNIDDRLEHLLNTGFKWLRVEILQGEKYGGKFWDVDWHSEEYSVDPGVDNAINELVNNGVSLVACLGCLLGELELQYADHGRFKTEEEVQLYLSYVSKVVRYFKGRIQYYEIWNEPNVMNQNWYVEASDYINLVHRTIPVILEEYPEAKIVVGSTADPGLPDGRDHLFRILNSDIMPLVDVISWHPGAGMSPEPDCYCVDYYYEYPSIVQEIKDVSSAHGFEGEFYAAEINWATPELQIPGYWQPIHSNYISAKYYSRGVIMHLGMDVKAGIISWGNNPTEENLTRNLCTILAGTHSVYLPIEIQSEASNIASYAFSLSNGDYLVAFWTDGVAVEDDPGISATLTLPDFSVGEVWGIDVLYGFEQQVNADTEDGNLVVRDLLVKDYPIILRFKDTSSP
jgi:hypothetical protein